MLAILGVRSCPTILLMFSLLLLYCSLLFLSLPRPTKSSALSTAIAANERLCFYVDADKAGEKIGVSTTCPRSLSLIERAQVLFCSMSNATRRHLELSVPQTRFKQEDRSI